MRNGRMRRIVELLKRIAQDKTYFGRVNKGFDFLGFHCCHTGMTVSAATLSRRDQKIARRYEQGASKERVGAFLRRWLWWAGVGGMLLGSMGCKSMVANLIDNDCGAHYGYVIVVDKTNDLGWRNCVDGSAYEWGTYVPRGRGDQFTRVYCDKGYYSEPDSYRVGLNCSKVNEDEYDNYGKVVIVKKDLSVRVKYNSSGLHSNNEIKIINEYEYQTSYDMNCNNRKNCMYVIFKNHVINKYWRDKVDEYLEIIEKIKNNEIVEPDEIINISNSR